MWGLDILQDPEHNALGLGLHRSMTPFPLLQIQKAPPGLGDLGFPPWDVCARFAGESALWTVWALQ